MKKSNCRGWYADCGDDPVWCGGNDGGVAVAATTAPGWDTEMGMYWQSVVTCGMDAPIAFGIVLSIVGLCFLQIRKRQASDE